MGEDVELCLEVQVDPASKKILSNPEKCRSALLDVTVVKPKEVEAFGTHRTNTLRADEVRKLITSMEKRRRKKQKVLDKLKDDDTIIQIRKHDVCQDHHKPRKVFTRQKSPVDELERKDFIGITESVEPLFCEIRRSLKNVETRITNMQDINLVISHTTIDQSASEEFVFCKRPNPSCHMRNHSVYRVETTPHELRSMLCCKNKSKIPEREDRLEGKCMCENCGIVGLLKECQKRPILSDSEEPPLPKSMLKKETRFSVPTSESFKNKLYDCSHIKQLNNKIQLLEERLSAQEERLVPKDYFKKIITKMVTNFSPKIFKSKSDTSMNCSEKPKKKVEKVVEKPKLCKSTETLCYNCTTQPTSRLKSDKATITDDDLEYSGFIWKWGEEILKPGIDLKNKIMSLLSEVLGKLNLNEKPMPEVKIKETPRAETDSEVFRRFMRQINTKVFNTQMTDKQFSKEFVKEKIPTYDSTHAKVTSHYLRRPDEGRRDSVKFNKSVNISYVNPKLSLWRTETTEACKGDKIDEKNNAMGKREFLKIISKAKQHQKDVLWTNIWNQAKANGQTKEDLITIKIPHHDCDGKEGQRLFETEISIGEVEAILKGG